MVLKIPELDRQKFESKLNEAKNNFERKKIEREIESVQTTAGYLVQIQFGIAHQALKYPVYFETLPRVTTPGTILESTFTTLIDYKYSPVFFGRLAYADKKHVFAKSPVSIPDDLFEGMFTIEGFKRGEFPVAQAISSFRIQTGGKILKIEGNKEIKHEKDELVTFLNTHGDLMKLLKKFPYASKRIFKTVDMPKNKVHFGNLDAECIGCILPVSETSMLIQVGGFDFVGKVFPLFKHLAVTLTT